MAYSTKSCIKINGQDIPWSFIQRVRRMCGGDWDQTMYCFWIARDKTGPNAVLKYIQKGFIPDEKGQRYCLRPLTLLEPGKLQAIRTWWQGLYEPKRETVSIKDIFAGIAAGTLK